MVTEAETAILLAKVSLIDNRRVTPETVHAWHELVEPFTLDELIAALTVFRRTRPGIYLEPGHLIQLVRFDRHQEALAHRAPPSPIITVGNDVKGAIRANP